MNGRIATLGGYAEGESGQLHQSLVLCLND